MAYYAKNTSVSVSKSKAEIERTLSRYGASEFAYGCNSQKAMIGFSFEKRAIRMTLKLPERYEFSKTSRGQERCDSAIEKLWEQACRQRWRALAFIIKAKLVAIDDDIATLDNEFLAYMALPGGSTVGQVLTVELDKIITTGQMPALLPGK